MSFCNFLLDIFVRDTPITRPPFVYTPPNRSTFNAYNLFKADDDEFLSVYLFCFPIIEFSPWMLCRSNRCRRVVGLLFIELWGDSWTANGQCRCKQPREGIWTVYYGRGDDSIGVEGDHSVRHNFHRRDGGCFSKIIVRWRNFPKSGFVTTSHKVFGRSLRSCFLFKR